MKHIGEVLKGHTVNSNNKYLHLPTVNSNNSLTIEEKINAILEEEAITPEGVAIMLAEGLNDAKSKNYYILLANEHNHGKLLQALSLTKEADREGKIRTIKAIYFQAILRKWGFKIKFR